MVTAQEQLRNPATHLQCSWAFTTLTFTEVREECFALELGPSATATTCGTTNADETIAVEGTCPLTSL